VEVTVHDANHNLLNGATVKGVWSVNGLNSNTCTTGELGGNGTCIMLFPSLSLSTPSVTFRIQKVTKSGQFYNSSDNHDVDGGTNHALRRVLGWLSAAGRGQRDVSCPLSRAPASRLPTSSSESHCSAGGCGSTVFR